MPVIGERKAVNKLWAFVWQRWLRYEIWGGEIVTEYINVITGKTSPTKDSIYHVPSRCHRTYRIAYDKVIRVKDWRTAIVERAGQRSTIKPMFSWEKP